MVKLQNIGKKISTVQAYKYLKTKAQLTKAAGPTTASGKLKLRIQMSRHIYLAAPTEFDFFALLLASEKFPNTTYLDPPRSRGGKPTLELSQNVYRQRKLDSRKMAFRFEASSHDQARDPHRARGKQF